MDIHEAHNIGVNLLMIRFLNITWVREISVRILSKNGITNRDILKNLNLLQDFNNLDVLYIFESTRFTQVVSKCTGISS